MNLFSDRSHLKWLVKRIRLGLRFAGLPIVRPDILRELPHDPGAHVQGLALHRGVLYEATGLMGQSSIRALDPESGALLFERRVADHWCEGIAVLGDLLYALTYRSEMALLFRLPDLDPAGEIPYRGEGWGLASDGETLAMTNGTAEITLRDHDMGSRKSIRAQHRGAPLDGLNDLEFLDRDRLLVNLYFDSILLELSVESGDVVRVVDCGKVVRRSGRDGFEQVFNGIARASQANRFFVTGKHWPRMFEISIPPA